MPKKKKNKVLSEDFERIHVIQGIVSKKILRSFGKFEQL
jgi:hypothetical protein